MDSNQEIEDLDGIVDADGEDSVSVDDFIKQLEAKEKDLHIASDTSVIELAESFDVDELPDFMKGEFEFAPSKIAPAPSQSATEQKPVSAPDSKLQKEITGLREKVSQLEADREELMKSSQRRAKDFDNFKSRTERERQESFQNQVGNLATRMLPALDNLNRAVDFALALPDETRSGIQQFFDGIVLVNEQVNEVLAEMGVQPIATVGEQFDPQYHEAVATEESTELEPNTVSTELLRGYRIGERVIRHSMVKVVKAPQDDVPTGEGTQAETVAEVSSSTESPEPEAE
jgi:molecular chaperone GrpE